MTVAGKPGDDLAPFATEPNTHYESRGVTYITFRDAITFIVAKRGECWVEANLGVASCHQQWDDVLTKVFAIANAYERSVDERVKDSAGTRQLVRT